MDLTFTRKQLLLLPVMLLLLLTLSGCRTRILPDSAGGLSVSENADGAPGDTAGTPASDASVSAAEPDLTEPGHRDAGMSGDATYEDPDARVKEYDEQASAEILEGAERLIHQEGEGDGAGVIADLDPSAASHLSGSADDTATQTVPSAQAEQMGVSEEAEAADSAMTYYTVLLRDRMDSVYECQRANVYWETDQDHVTVYKTSPEHSLITGAGAYDVSARLLPENLRVDDGWVVRKNPQVIVKVVDRSVLGSGVAAYDAAQQVYAGLISRSGWNAVDAVRGGQVLLLSRELLETPYLQTAAMLVLAKCAQPSLFADIRPEEALQQLSEEATGSVQTGLYWFTGRST